MDSPIGPSVFSVLYPPVVFHNLEWSCYPGNLPLRIGASAHLITWIKTSIKWCLTSQCSPTSACFLVCRSGRLPDFPRGYSQALQLKVGAQLDSASSWSQELGWWLLNFELECSLLPFADRDPLGRRFRDRPLAMWPT